VLTATGETIGTEIGKSEDLPQNFTKVSEQKMHFLHIFPC